MSESLEIGQKIKEARKKAYEIYKEMQKSPEDYERLKGSYAKAKKEQEQLISQGFKVGNSFQNKAPQVGDHVSYNKKDWVVSKDKGSYIMLRPVRGGDQVEAYKPDVVVINIDEKQYANSFQNGRNHAIQEITNKAKAVGVKLENIEDTIDIINATSRVKELLGKGHSFDDALRTVANKWNLTAKEMDRVQEKLGK